MDMYARKYDDASEVELEGREGDALGPVSDRPFGPVRQPDEAATVETLVARAHLALMT